MSVGNTDVPSEQSKVLRRIMRVSQNCNHPSLLGGFCPSVALRTEKGRPFYSHARTENVSLCIERTDQLIHLVAPLKNVCPFAPTWMHRKQKLLICRSQNGLWVSKSFIWTLPSTTDRTVCLLPASCISLEQSHRWKRFPHAISCFQQKQIQFNFLACINWDQRS